MKINETIVFFVIQSPRLAKLMSMIYRSNKKRLSSWKSKMAAGFQDGRLVKYKTIFQYFHTQFGTNDIKNILYKKHAFLGENPK